MKQGKPDTHPFAYAPREAEMDLPPFLRQAVKAQNSLKENLSHGVVSQAVHQRVQTGRGPAAGAGGIHRRSSTGGGGQRQRFAPLAPGVPPRTGKRVSRWGQAALVG